MRNAELVYLGDSQLKNILDEIYAKYHNKKYLEKLDPLGCVRRFKRRDEREAAGLIAASLAYGRVEIIVRNINIIIDDIMNGEPIKFIRDTTYKQKLKLLANFKHRFNDGEDIAALCESIKIITGKYQSLEKCFCGCMSESGNDFKTALTLFTNIIKSNAQKFCGERKSFEYLIPSPSKGSACKRMLMYLRWMIRENDSIDLGVWKSVSPSHLLIPVDTHVAKIARHYGLTTRNNADWKMAEEITNALRKFDPRDPVKYDFALCHAGMIEFRK